MWKMGWSGGVFGRILRPEWLCDGMERARTNQRPSCRLSARERYIAIILNPREHGWMGTHWLFRLGLCPVVGWRVYLDAGRRYSLPFIDRLLMSDCTGTMLICSLGRHRPSRPESVAKPSSLGRWSYLSSDIEATFSAAEEVDDHRRKMRDALWTKMQSAILRHLQRGRR